MNKGQDVIQEIIVMAQPLEAEDVTMLERIWSPIAEALPWWGEWGVIGCTGIGFIVLLKFAIQTKKFQFVADFFTFLGGFLGKKKK